MINPAFVRVVDARSLARDEQLVAALHHLGVEHLVLLQPGLPCAPLSPVYRMHLPICARHQSAACSLPLLILILSAAIFYLSASTFFSRMDTIGRCRRNTPSTTRKAECS